MPRRQRTNPRSGYNWRFSTRDRKREPVDLTSEDRPGEMYDDVVLDDWFHMEWLNDSRGVDTWWMRVGDASLCVEVRGKDARTFSIERGIYGRVLPDSMPPGELRKAPPKAFLHKATRLPRRRLIDWEVEVGRIVDRLLAGRFKRSTAVHKLLDYFGRGVRVIAVDRERTPRRGRSPTMDAIECELASLGYMTQFVDLGSEEDRTAPGLCSKIVVTRRGGLLLREIDKLDSALIWIKSKGTPRELAMKVHAVLRQVDFGRDRCQAVEV